jgi:hypothetical protein
MIPNFLTRTFYNIMLLFARCEHAPAELQELAQGMSDRLIIKQVRKHADLSRAVFP